MNKQEQIEKMSEILHKDLGIGATAEITAKTLSLKGYVNGADFVEYLKSIVDVYEVGIQPRRIYEITDHQFDTALQEYLKGGNHNE